MSKKKKGKEIYSVRYVGGQGYWDMDGSYNDGTADEGLTHNPKEWLKEHNDERVADQCTDLQWEIYQNCDSLEAAIVYCKEKYGMDADTTECEWEEITSVTEDEDDFEFNFQGYGNLD